MYEWIDFYLPCCSGSTEYFPAAQPRTTLAFLHLKRVNQNVYMEAELLDLTFIL